MECPSCDYATYDTPAERRRLTHGEPVYGSANFVWGQLSQPQQGELLQLYSAEPAFLRASLERDLRFVH